MAKKLQMRGNVKFPTITRGSTVGGGATYSYDGGVNWYDIDMLGYTPTYNFLTSNGLSSNMIISPNLLDAVAFSWSSGSFGLSHVTHDGGKSWESTYYANMNLIGTHWNQDNPRHGYTGGWTTPWKTTDGGENFSNITLTGGKSSAVVFDSSDDENYVYASVGSGGVQYSTNQGSTWTEVATGMGGSHNILKCDGSGQYVMAYYGNYNADVALSDDYGLSYSILPNSNNGQACMKKDGTLMVYTDGDADASIMYSTDQGSTFNNFANPWPLGVVRFANDFVNNDIYVWAQDESEIYKFNNDNDGLILVRNLDHVVGSYAPSQYGRGAVYVESGGINIHYAKNYQTYKQIGTGTAGYVMIL